VNVQGVAGQTATERLRNAHSVCWGCWCCRYRTTSEIRPSHATYQWGILLIGSFCSFWWSRLLTAVDLHSSSLYPGRTLKEFSWSCC